MLRVIVLVLAAQCLLTTAEDDLPNTEDVRRKCQEEYQLDEEAVALLKRSTILETKDPKIQCFVKCMLVQFKAMNDAGDILLDDARRRYPKGMPELEKCANVTGTDSCDKAVNFQNCLLQNMNLEEQPPE